MKRNLMTIVSLMTLATMTAFTSCTKEATTGNGSQFRATMEGCNAAKTELNGTALEWVGGDRIAVYGTGGAGIYSATPQTPATVAVFDNVSGETGGGPFRAFYPASLTTDGVNITLPSTQTYVEGSINEFPMYAESSDNQLAFKNLCGVLKLHLTKANTNISSITVTANAEINGTFSVNYNSGDPELTYSANGTNTTTLTCTTAQSIAEGKDYYIYLPEGNYSGLQIEMFTDDSRYCIKHANTTINVTRSQYTLITLGETLVFRPIGSKGGLFSINADGSQVWFSQGNLQYQASTQTWRFAENQYDYVGQVGENNYGSDGNVYENGVRSRNDYIDIAYSGWIDLFGWGTGNNPILHTSIAGDYTNFVDWGVNAISNGGNTGNIWRTLTNDEWNYLLNTRTGAANKWGTGSVNGMHGIILLPDSWTLPDGGHFSSGGNSDWGNWTRNTYTNSEWVDMESAGAIFLPAAGYRGWKTFFIGWQGVYWSSTDLGDGPRAFSFYHDGFSSIIGTMNPCDGSSVRLIRDNS